MESPNSKFDWDFDLVYAIVFYIFILAQIILS
jgi:hypothetical protein